MDRAELQRLVAEIGEEILARIGYGSACPCKSPEQRASCSGCNQSCSESCAGKTNAIIAAGAARVSSCRRVVQVDPAIASLIDHTLLKPEAARDDIRKLCREAREYGFASVCVNPYWVSLAAAELAGTTVKVCTVVGFPLGANTTETKMAEAESAIRAGAQEIDMVINVGALRSGDLETVKADIQGVIEISHRAGALVKTILETALLDDNQKAIACSLAKMAGADFVKTSTGFGPGGATDHDVALMRKIVGPDVGVKAAGGIRTLDDFQKMVQAGATRIGASASVKIVEAART